MRYYQRNKHALYVYLALFFAGMLFTFWIAGILLAPDPPAIPSSYRLGSPGTPSLTIEVPVYRTATNQIEKLPLEEYLVGVVAAEMPQDFEMEALKAQAITARTYIIRRIVEGDTSDVPVGAWVNDSIQHQAYLDDPTLQLQWGREFKKNRRRIEKAVYETAGQVLTYKGRPITATFFSTSNGYTENSEEYWSENFPYLRSVASPWDQESPKYKQTISLPLRILEQKLGVKVSNLGKSSQWSQVLKQTTGQRIAAIKVGNKTFTGREVRELLDLNSSSFTWEVEGKNLIITTYGYGHGVGMSQWGANGMAKEGKTAEEILTYYYTDVAIEDYRQWLRD